MEQTCGQTASFSLAAVGAGRSSLGRWAKLVNEWEKGEQVARRFVPCDFNQHSVKVAMAHAGYSEAARTFILWEGVTNYLTEAAVDATLRWCSRAAEGSSLLFTYVHRDVLTRPQAFIGTE